MCGEEGGGVKKDAKPAIEAPLDPPASNVKPMQR